ncbi:LysR substrate-binding domain-containing protein [Janibacter melonis]|uniref:LysR substrate-binding domain-containing protein n=1 Tax=Janibacter melonis TaxID=262209 RepID=UPI0035585756
MRFELTECEPPEAYELLLHDDLDLALTYDYQVAPASVPTRLVTHPLWQARWGVAVPAADAHLGLADLGDRAWITNSRNTADEIAVRFLGGLAGIAPASPTAWTASTSCATSCATATASGWSRSGTRCLPASPSSPSTPGGDDRVRRAPGGPGRVAPLRTLLDAVGAPARAAAGSTS